MAFSTLFSKAFPTIALDLGCYHLGWYLCRQEKMGLERSVGVMDLAENRWIEFGDKAANREERGSRHLEVLPLVKRGYLYDMEGTKAWIEDFLRRFEVGYSLTSPKILLATPVSYTPSQCERLSYLVTDAGARSCTIFPQNGLSLLGTTVGREAIENSEVSLLIDVGHEMTQISLMSGLQPLVVKHEFYGVSDLEKAVASHFRSQFHLEVGVHGVRDFIRSFDFAGRELTVWGKDLLQCFPRSVKENGLALQNILLDFHARIHLFLQQVLEVSPYDVLVKLHQSSLVLTGGGSLLPGLVDYLQRESSFSVHQADSPMNSVLEGYAYVLDNEAGKRWQKPLVLLQQENQGYEQLLV